MTVGEWTGLVAVCFMVIGPAVVGWVTLRSKLDLILLVQTQMRDSQAKQDKEIQELWKVHNHQEGRLYMQDRIIVKILEKMDIDESIFSPKEKPHMKGNPGQHL